MNSARRRRQLWHPLLMFVIMLLLAWPAFVAGGTLMAALTGDAWQLNAWTLLPKRVLLQELVAGYRASVLPAGICATLGVIDHHLLGRFTSTRWLRGVLLPVAGAVAGKVLLPEHDTAWISLMIAGCLLVFFTRILLASIDLCLRRGWR